VMATPRKYVELRERAVRLYFESGGRPIAQVARDLGIHREALRQWVRQGGGRPIAAGLVGAGSGLSLQHLQRSPSACSCAFCRRLTVE
jgi:transposase